MITVRLNECISDYTDLICPKCGETYLHSGKVEVFNRREDAPMVDHVTVETNGRVTQGDARSGVCPSTRRHAIAIWFMCETCGEAEHRLVLAQHKGNTHVFWDRIGDAMVFYAEPDNDPDDYDVIEDI